MEGNGQEARTQDKISKPLSLKRKDTNTNNYVCFNNKL